MDANDTVVVFKLPAARSMTKNPLKLVLDLRTGFSPIEWDLDSEKLLKETGGQTPVKLPLPFANPHKVFEEIWRPDPSG